MQVTIARQLGLDPSTVSNFFMNARRRSVDKWKDERSLLANRADKSSADSDYDDDEEEEEDIFDDEEKADSPQPAARAVIVANNEQHIIGAQVQPQQQPQQPQQQQQLILVKASTGQFISASTASPAAVVQHLGGCGGDLTPTSLGSAASLDL